MLLDLRRAESDCVGAWYPLRLQDWQGERSRETEDPQREKIWLRIYHGYLVIYCG